MDFVNFIKTPTGFLVVVGAIGIGVVILRMVKQKLKQKIEDGKAE